MGLRLMLPSSGMNESSLLTSGTYGDHTCVCVCVCSHCALTDSRFQVNGRETRDK